MPRIEWDEMKRFGTEGNPIQRGSEIKWTYLRNESYSGKLSAIEDSILPGMGGMRVKDVDPKPTASENSIENKDGEWFFYHNQIIDGPTLVSESSNESTVTAADITAADITAPDITAQVITAPEVSFSQMCSNENEWKYHAGTIQMQNIVMPSKINPAMKFGDAIEYITLKNTLNTIERYQKLWEFFNKNDKEGDGITYEQYTTLVNLPIKLSEFPKMTKIIKTTKDDLNKFFGTTSTNLSYVFHRSEYEAMINELNQSRQAKNEKMKMIPNIPSKDDGALVLSYYEKKTDIHQLYFIRKDGSVSSTKSPSSNYSFAKITDVDIVFTQNNVRKTLSSVFSYSRGGKVTRRRRSKSSTKKISKKGGKQRKTSKK